ncbi:MAG: DUF6175 family protein [Bacteroidales bacterium]
MKKILLSLLLGFISIAAFSQAKKPTIMIVPSDAYCFRNVYTTSYKNEVGKDIIISDYYKAVSRDEDLRLAISELSKIMAKRGFPLKDLEAQLKKLKIEEVEDSFITAEDGDGIIESPLDQLKRTAKADIIMDIDFQIFRRGPKKYISFNLRGLDAYTSKIITAVSGDGQPTTSASVGILIEEAVLSYMDDFNSELQQYFNDMFTKGRESVISLKMFESSAVKFTDEYEFKGETVQLIDIIDYWLDENCVNHRFSRTQTGDYTLQYEQVRTPLFRTILGKERATDTRAFVRDLQKFLEQEPVNLTGKIYVKGLGEAWLILGNN